MQPKNAVTNQNCCSRGISSGIFRVIRRLTKQAFTLIELLVVVLIIGILTAVAVAQYKKAVEKAEDAKMLSTLRPIVQSAQRYYLANGTYTSSFNGLDISLPLNTKGTCNRDYSFDDAVIHVEDYCITLVNSPRSVRISKYPGWQRGGNGKTKAFAYILVKEWIIGWTRYVEGLYCLTDNSAPVGKHCTGSIKYNNAFGKYYQFK